MSDIPHGIWSRDTSSSAGRCSSGQWFISGVHPFLAARPRDTLTARGVLHRDADAGRQRLHQGQIPREEMLERSPTATLGPRGKTTVAAHGLGPRVVVSSRKVLCMMAGRCAEHDQQSGDRRAGDLRCPLHLSLHASLWTSFSHAKLHPQQLRTHRGPRGRVGLKALPLAPSIGWFCNRIRFACVALPKTCADLVS